jgi:hypothetical protein
VLVRYMVRREACGGNEFCEFKEDIRGMNGKEGDVNVNRGKGTFFRICMCINLNCSAD